MWTAAELAEYEPSLRAAAANLCRQASDVDDLIQDAFERGLRHLQAGHPRPVRMVGWLITIMRNSFIDRLRRRLPASEQIDEAQQTPAHEATPAWNELSLETVRAALGRLDHGLAAVIDLHYIQGLRYREVAARLGIAENTVASRMFRARKVLHAALSKELVQ